MGLRTMVRFGLCGAALHGLAMSAAHGLAVGPTPLPTMPPLCGNGRLDWDEECDDGNLLADDVCPAGPGDECRYSTSGKLIHGDRRLRAVRQRGCVFGWYVVNPAQAPLADGSLAERQECVDQDPACDFDPRPGRCRFQVVACLNNDDVGLPQCVPPGVSGTRIARPAQASARANFDALAEALTHLHDPGRPQDEYSQQPALLAKERNYCSRAFPIDVELGRRPRRSEELMVDVWSGSGKTSQKHRARLELSCAR